MYIETDISWHFRCLVVVRNLTTFHMWYSRKAYTVLKKDKESSFPNFQSSHDNDFLCNGCIYTHYMKQNEHCKLLTWINNFNICNCNTSALSLICIIHFYFLVHQEGMLYLEKKTGLNTVQCIFCFKDCSLVLSLSVDEWDTSLWCSHWLTLPDYYSKGICWFLSWYF